MDLRKLFKIFQKFAYYGYRICAHDAGSVPSNMHYSVQVSENFKGKNKIYRSFLTNEYLIN